MSSNLLARLVVGSLPDQIRADRSQEIAGTLLDASDHSRIAFAREAASVLGAGVRWRIRQAVTQPASTLRDALTWAALMIAAGRLLNSLWFTLRAGAVLDTQHLLLMFGPAAVLTCFTLRLVRPASVLGVIWAVALLLGVPHLDSDVFWPQALPLGLALVGFATMGGGKRQSTLARGAWIAPAGFFALANFTSILGAPPTAALVLAFSALLLVPFLLSCALGVALAWASTSAAILLSGAAGASTTVVCLELTASLPIVLLALLTAQRLSGRHGQPSET